MSESLKHFIPKFVTQKRYDKVKSILFYALFIQILTSLIIASFFYFGADIISNNYFKTIEAKETLKVFAFFFIGINILQTINAFFMAVQDTFSCKITDTIRMFFIMFFVLFIFFGNNSSLLNYSYSWLIGLYIGIIVVISIFLIKYYKKYFIGEKLIFEKKLIKKIASYAGLVFLGASAGTILSQIDMQMIIYLLGSTQAGYYTVYLSIIGIPFLIITPIFQLLLPVFSELYFKNNLKQILKLKAILYRGFIIIGIFTSLILFVFSKKLSFILFGENYNFSGEIIRYSSLFLTFNFLLQINFNILASIGKISYRVKIITIAIIINFILNLILINIIGTPGAALATGIGWIIIWGLSEIPLKDFKIRFKIKEIIINLFTFIFIGFLSNYFLLSFFDDLNRIKSLILFLFIFIIYAIIFILINNKILKNIYKKIRN